jgi:hypothetical protein
MQQRIYECTSYIFILLEKLREKKNDPNFESFYSYTMHDYKQTVNRQLHAFPTNAAELIAFSEKLAEAFKASLSLSPARFSDFGPQASLGQTTASRRSSSSSAYPANWDQSFLQRRDSLEKPDPGQVPRPRPPPARSQSDVFSVDTGRPIGEQPRDASPPPVHPSTGDTAHRILEVSSDPVTLENCNIRPADTLAQMQQKVRDAYAHYLTQNRRAYASYMQERLSQCTTILDPLLRSLRSPTNDSAKTMQFYHQIIESQYNDDPKNKDELNTFIDKLGENFKATQRHVPAAKQVPMASNVATAAPRELDSAPNITTQIPIEREQSSVPKTMQRPRDNYPYIPEPPEEIPRTVYRELRRVTPFRKFGIHPLDTLETGREKITAYHRAHNLLPEDEHEHKQDYELVFHPIIEQMKHYDRNNTAHAQTVLRNVSEVIDQIHQRYPEVAQQKKQEAQILVLVALAHNTKIHMAPATHPLSEPLPEWIQGLDVEHKSIQDLFNEIKASSPDAREGARRCTAFASKYWPLILNGYFPRAFPFASRPPNQVVIPSQARNPVFFRDQRQEITAVHPEYTPVAQQRLFQPTTPIITPDRRVIAAHLMPSQMPQQVISQYEPPIQYTQGPPIQRMQGQPMHFPGMRFGQPSIHGQPIHFPGMPAQNMRGPPMQQIHMPMQYMQALPTQHPGILGDRIGPMQDDPALSMYQTLVHYKR